MSNTKYSILSTKTLPPELVQEAAEHAIAVEAQTFIDITPVVTPALQERLLQLVRTGGVLVFTSPNAVHAVMDAVPPARWSAPLTQEPMPGRRVYCLQGATRQAAEDRLPGAVIAGTAANSAELAHRIIADQVPAVVFCCGNIRRNELPELLKAHHISVEEHVVYRTTETPAAITRAYDGILFLSPSSVRSFFSANTPPGHTVCFAIGETTAAALREATDNKVIVSHAPSVATLLETAIYYFDNINCYE